MTQEQVRQFLKQGIEQAKAKHNDKARVLLQNAIKLDPRNELAWLWLSSIARNPKERAFCLRELFKINPQNEMAIKGLQALGVNVQQLQQQMQMRASPQEAVAQAQQPPTRGIRPIGTSAPVTTPPSETTGGVPLIDQARLSIIQPAIDEFLQSYIPIPAGLEDIAWQLKPGGLYGIAAARRQRARRVGGIGCIIVMVLIVLIGGAIMVLSGRGEATVAEATKRPTSTATFTHTSTPTNTPGVDNTPSPTPRVSETPIPIPDNLVAGDIYGGESTPIYPVPAQLPWLTPIALYSIGDYDAASEIFATERAINTNICYADLYYYDVLSLVEQNDPQKLRQAEILINEALSSNNCKDRDENSPLLYTAACIVDYYSYLNGETDKLQEAYGWCDAAREESKEAPIPLNITTLARIYAVQGNINGAIDVLNQALDTYPSDLNLLLVRARMELLRNLPANALTFIARALYIDPVSEQALRLRVEAYLKIAELESDPQLKIQQYGTAVVWTQEYRIFYPGRLEGYLLMARARYGEGNPNLAEEALDSIIGVKDLFPPDNPIVREAYTLRAQLYQETGRYQDAFDDTQALFEDDSDSLDLQLLEQQTMLAYQLGGDYYTLVQEGLAELMAVNVDEAGQTTRPELQLLDARLRGQICEFEEQIECDYQDVYDLLTDNDFLDLLTDEQLIEARSYRAKAKYHLTLAQDDLSNSLRIRANQEALDDIESVLAVRQTALDEYYHGLILEALEEPEEALRVYRWVLFWSQSYEYPFVNAVQARVDALTEEET